MSRRLRRGLIIIFFVISPFIVGLLCTFEIIKVQFPTDMADQVSIGYQEDPRLLPPVGSIPIQGLSVLPDEFPQNPIASNSVSLQRGQLLYDVHCALCHGQDGHGTGPLGEYFDRTPENLTKPEITAEFDGSVFLTITEGFGEMPPLAENLTVRERWDIVNYVRTLPAN